MYLEHFGLREAPFRITPHTEFFFAGANRGATLEALIYAITHDEGIVKVSGEVGSGKTMLCRMLLEKLPENVETVYIANPLLSRGEILYAIAEELQVSLPDGRPHLLLRALQDRLIEIYAAGHQVVVMIDEAHAMPAETLEEIRLLSNLESSQHKLLHIVLFGQPELDTHLRDISMRQLKERITHNFALEPLRRSDIGSYLMFRIRAAGYHGPDLFTPKAVQLISLASEGLTRRINILADKALLSAFSENKHLIDNRQIKAAIRDAQFNPMHDGAARPKTWITVAIVITVIASLAYFAGNYSFTKNTAPNTAPTLQTKLVVPPALPSVDAPKPIPTESPVTPTAITLEERLAASEEWLKNTSDSHYFIQLFSAEASNRFAIESFLENSTKGFDQQKIRVYRSGLSGRDKFGVIYGDYQTRAAANAELANLAKIGDVSRAYVRAVSKLR